MIKIMYFTAPWCFACKGMDMVLNGLPGVEKINIDEHPDMANGHHIMSLPTTIILRNENVIWRRSGIVTRKEIIEGMGCDG